MVRFLRRSPITDEFVTRTRDLLRFLIPHYVAEGKRYLTIGVGCTGGRHRSVAVAQALRQHRECNAWWQGDFIRYFNDVHIGMAVAGEQGLSTPVIRHADQKGLRQPAAPCQRGAFLAPWIPGPPARRGPRRGDPSPSAGGGEPWRTAARVAFSS